MNELDAALSSLRADFAVATVPGGGLLLHLPSGDFFPLGGPESVVWDAIARTETGAAASAATAVGLSLPPSDALALLERVVEQTRALRGSAGLEALRFHDDGPTFSLRSDRQILLSVDKESLLLSATKEAAARTNEEMAELLRVFVPKLFGRWYPLALHSSAVAIGARTVLFCGSSGAGKTTTARVLAEEVSDSRVLSEDVVLFARNARGLTMVEDAEVAIQAWMNEATVALIEERRPACDASTLRRALEARTGRLEAHKVVFLEPERRHGGRWSLSPLPPAAALARLFLHSFFHSSDPAVLRAHLESCRTLAMQIQAAEAQEIPSGLDALRRCSRAQIETIAS